MMSMFSKYLDMLPPFRKYWDHLFEKKQMVVVASESGAKVLQFAELRKELFLPSDPTNAATDERLVQLARVAAQKFLTSYTMKRRQRGSICPSQARISHIRDARQMFGMNCSDERQQMIEVRVP